MTLPLRVPPPSGGGVLTMALVVPLHGPAGIFGPSCESCAALAVEEINAEGGVLGRELNLVPVDGGNAPEVVATEIDALIRAVGGVSPAAPGSSPTPRS